MKRASDEEPKRIVHDPHSHPEEWDGRTFMGSDGYTMHLDSGGFFEEYFSPKVGAVGFYYPDPSSGKSPNVVLAIDGDKVVVYEAKHEMVFEIDCSEWMSLAEMQSAIFHKAMDGDLHENEEKQNLLKAYIRTMADAVRVTQELPHILANNPVVPACNVSPA